MWRLLYKLYYWLYLWHVVNSLLQVGLNLLSLDDYRLKLKWTVSLNEDQRSFFYFNGPLKSIQRSFFRNFFGPKATFPGNKKREYSGNSPIFGNSGNSPANRGNPFPGNMQRRYVSGNFYLVVYMNVTSDVLPTNEQYMYYIIGYIFNV